MAGYLFLMLHDVERPVLAAALAGVLSLPVEAVDVGDDGQDDRQWDRAISCTVTPLDGDLRLHLDVYFADSISSPSLADAAGLLARRVGTLVAYKSEEFPPSAHWLVGPEGRHVRARLVDEDEDGNLLESGYRIGAVETPVERLPRVAVDPLPVSCLLWLHDEPTRARLATALADLFSLPIESVDVDTNESDDRNWEAPILCTVTRIGGDLRQHLDIHAADEMSERPSQEAAAAWLAGKLGTAGAYQALSIPPDAFWLVGPDGRRARARIEDDESDGDLTLYRIDAVEHRLAGAGELTVAAVPEVIRHYRLPTPLVDDLRSRFGMSSTTADSARHATSYLAVWEGLVARLVAGWYPDGWYPPEYYREDLETRDLLTDAAEALPEPVRVAFAQALATIDERFAAATVDDGGEALASRTGSVPDRWWWHRITRPVPWRNMPGASP
ncbi:hypothetical protein AB0G04_39010 [Actinoplanes sp. NPDC023801]|uniref:hypothetical protein n=1 Tax=Actinoplanes sp. NPDC023801 TaxID=3154595 RepID=UPI0033E3C599